MLTVAGGIIIALFILMVLIGLVLVVRDSVKFVFRFVRANAMGLVILTILSTVVLYHYAWYARSAEASIATDR